MIEDMRMRRLEAKTQQAYVRAILKLSAFLGRSPATATAEDLRSFQLHLADSGTSPITINATLSGLKFFFGITLDRAHLLSKVQPVHVPQTLPVVLSRDEVARLLRERTLMLAWKPSHMQALRLQVTTQRDAVEFESPARRAWQLQYVLAFGAHGAHAF
jgi:site-specific recombinase XerD